MTLAVTKLFCSRLTPAAMASVDTSISVCSLCTGTEVVWSPVGDSSKGYMCSKCLDQQHLTRHRNAVVTLHRQLHAVSPQISIPYIYDFVFPTSHKQWRLLNRHNYVQRKRTLHFVMRGAPGSNNWIYDLHKQLQHQRTGGAIRKGRRYYSSSVVDRSDLYTILCEFLI